MRAHAIVQRQNDGGVTIQTSGGHTALAIFYDYGEAVKVLSGFDDMSEYRIINVEIEKV